MPKVARQRSTKPNAKQSAGVRDMTMIAVKLARTPFFFAQSSESLKGDQEFVLELGHRVLEKIDWDYFINCR